MSTLHNGQFSFTIAPEELARGLRPSRYSPRNQRFLTDCDGAIGVDRVLQTLQELTRLNTGALGALTFPYPQLFVFTNLIVICTSIRIYEWVGGALVLKFGPTTAGIEWSMIDHYDHIYASNGKVAVVRDPNTKIWTATGNLPVFSAVADYNGQVMIGAPGVLR